MPASRYLIVLPDDTAKPILDAVNGAQKSIWVKMFVFSDPALLKAVAAAKQKEAHFNKGSNADWMAYYLTKV